MLWLQLTTRRLINATNISEIEIASSESRTPGNPRVYGVTATMGDSQRYLELAESATALPTGHTVEEAEQFAEEIFDALIAAIRKAKPGAVIELADLILLVTSTPEPTE